MRIATVPALAGVRFRLGRRTLVSGRNGVATTRARSGTYRLSLLDTAVRRGRVRARFARWGDDAFDAARTLEVRGPLTLQVGFETSVRIDPTFVDRAGQPVSPDRLRSLTLTNTIGSRVVYRPGRPLWVIAGRVARRLDGLEQTHIQYAVAAAVMEGTSVVHRAQQRFYPRESPRFRVRLLLYRARVGAHDLLFGFHVGRRVLFVYPNGRRVEVPVGRDGTALLTGLPRGTYGVKVLTTGYAPAVPMALSRDQLVDLRVITRLDLGVFALLAITLTLGLVLLRRPHLRTRLNPLRRARTAGVVALALALAGAAGARPAAAQSPIPALAYYYIWYDHGSWRRAKTDYPLLGRYSSGDLRIMRRHVAWAKRAGLDGFLVSWKSTPRLDARLAQLVRVVDAARFHLGIVYEGLDFDREPLPVAQVAHDLDAFARRYAADPAFALRARPIVVWSGTWRYTPRQIAYVSRRVRSRLLLLASEKSVDGYERIAPLVDGDAYYWSSVDPDRDRSFARKLADLGAAVHVRAGYWIAPAAPGFDARLIGGTRVVERRNGDTLRREWAAALASSPDAIGVISWNEFSENSEVEPSVRYGTRYLTVVHDVVGAGFTVRGDMDSSDPPRQQFGYGLPLLIGVGAVLLTGLGALLWRREVKKSLA